MGASLLVDTVREAGRRFGERPAFVADAGWALSYAELDGLSDRVASALASRGLGPGDVLALVLPAVPEYPAAYAAAAKLGVVTAGVNPRLTPPERAAVLATAQPDLVLATPELAPSGWDTVVLDPASGPTQLFEDLLGFSPRRSSKTPGGPGGTPDQDAPVALVFTSGTTGAPKAAVFGDRQLRAITAIDVGERWGGGGPSLAGTALAHLGFMTKLPGNLRRGSTQFLRLRWRADEALRLTVEQRIPAISGIPTQVALMLRQPGLDRMDLSGVQAVVMGGGPVTPALVREARDRFGAVVMTRYSCTEAGVGVGTGPTDPPEDAEETVGRPRGGVELAVLDEDDEPVAPGAVGSVGLRSAAVMRGYWHDPIATAAAFTADEYVRTGDLGWLDDRGRLHLAGRSKEMYVRGGYNVHPFEVEAVLAGHPDVAAVAVVPRADPVMGEIGVAVVVPRPGAAAPSLEALRRHAHAHLARFKLPEDLVVAEALPLTAMDKIDRAALVRLVTSP